jgi:hypothetical protein
MILRRVLQIANGTSDLFFDASLRRAAEFILGSPDR